MFKILRGHQLYVTSLSVVFICIYLIWHAQFLQNLSEEHDLEKAELFSHIQSLEKEISYLSSSSLAREKENLRKDLEKTKTKLKETESKLKNAIQEKTKLEVCN